METAEHDRRNVARLLAGGAALHLLATFVIYASGRLQIRPNAVSPAGVLRGDAEGYFEKSLTLGGHVSGLFTHDEQVHVRLYAFSSAVPAPLVVANILSLWLVGLSPYLLTLRRRARLRRRSGRALLPAVRRPLRAIRPLSQPAA